MAAALDRKAAQLALVRGNGRAPHLRDARRVRRGVYCTDPRRAATVEEAVVAALLVLPSGCAAAGLSAARLWRIDGLVPPQVHEPLEFLVPGFKNSVRLTGCTLHFDAVTGVALDGVPATALARTVIDVAARCTFSDAVSMVEAA